MVLAELDKKVDYYKRLTFADTTKKCYRTHRNTFIKFCNDLGLCGVPASTETLVRYAAFLAGKMKFGSVKQYLNIIRILHLEWDLPNPIQNNFQLQCVLKGIKRDKGDFVKQKQPITPDILVAILGKLNVSSVTDANFWAICLVMFYGLLRKSNVLVDSTSNVNCIRRNDIAFHRWGAAITIKHTKTIQFHERQLTIPYPRSKDNPLCPAQAIFHALRTTSTVSGTNHAFHEQSSVGLRPFTYKTFLQRLRELLKLCNLAPGDTIRVLGDWKSNAYVSYIKLTSLQLQETITTMQNLS